MVKFAFAMFQRVRMVLSEQRGSQTMEWLLLIGLIGFLVLGIITFFQDKSTEVGQTIWDMIKAWINKVKPT